METALVPYRLNKFFFQGQEVRKRFEKSARAGKKRAQKRAVGKYEIMDRADFEKIRSPAEAMDHVNGQGQLRRACSWLMGKVCVGIRHLQPYQVCLACTSTSSAPLHR